MARYVGSYLAFKGQKFQHCIGMIESDSEDEANGKALRLAKSTIYPVSDGYFNHSVTFVREDELHDLLNN